MARDWSREEVEATVADYLRMLDLDLGRMPYNKSGHRRTLARLLSDRTEGAIERKHQNISAVLIELGFPYISGYQPLRNYQQLLYEVVSDRLISNSPFVDLVRRHVEEPAQVPVVQDILAAQVAHPKPDSDRESRQAGRVQEGFNPRCRWDYLAMEARNRSLGAAGEQFVVRFEKARLARAGKERLASRVEHVAETRGDGLGFDVLSFEETGDERWIEVKTTAYGSWTPFFVTRKELRVSRDAASRYFLYRAFEFRRRPRFFVTTGPLDSLFRMEPSLYVAKLT